MARFKISRTYTYSSKYSKGFCRRILRTEPNKTSVERRIQRNVATVATVWSVENN